MAQTTLSQMCAGAAARAAAAAAGQRALASAKRSVNANNSNVAVDDTENQNQEKKLPSSIPMSMPLIEGDCNSDSNSSLLMSEAPVTSTPAPPPKSMGRKGAKRGRTMVSRFMSTECANNFEGTLEDDTVREEVAEPNFPLGDVEAALAVQHILPLPTDDEDPSVFIC